MAQLGEMEAGKKEGRARGRGGKGTGGAGKGGGRFSTKAVKAGGKAVGEEREQE